MNKASLWPDNALKCRGDKVIEVTFFGAEFTDKYVDILESIPDVGELCRDLRLLPSKYAAIKPAGAERLRKLFPKAEIRVATMTKGGRG